ncbi:meteorin-like protein [Periophthalmus magnuspinnatus]|uniref:meteorin-like protein n=1 Tax=Periophthalmus magnuspinnatus TaxID=409849 RepID=UPI00145BA4BC|nr:meteorin-like protein [Periophthalmus magnuspinnatus]
MSFNVIIWIYLATFLTSCTTDFCNWTGSFTDEKGPGLVLQVRLRCAAGWIRWFSPGQALRVVLEPTLSSTPRPSVCIEPSPSLRGVRVFIERSGRLTLLATEKVTCFRADGDHGPVPVIYLETSVQSTAPWRRRTVGLKYELTYPRTGASPGQTGPEGDLCRPCNNTELLMAICVSDFVVRGSIQKVSHNSNRQTSLIHVSLTRVYKQHSNMFEQQPTSHWHSMSSPSWSGHISTLLQCRIKPGEGEFLFTGSEHFGNAWLGCAPRFKDFLSMYHSARAARSNPCNFPLD